MQNLRNMKNIHMPTNRAAGFVIAMFITVMGFGLIWHIWWLVVVIFIASIISFIVFFHEESGLLCSCC